MTDWIEQGRTFVRDIGICGVVILIAVIGSFGLVMGVIPSKLTAQHDQIIRAVTIGNIIATGGFYNDNAMCVNQTYSIPSGAARTQAVHNCTRAHLKTLATLRSMGWEFPAPGDNIDVH